MSNETLAIEGKIIKVFDAVKISESFTKRALIIETDDRYPQTVQIDFTQHQTSLLDDKKEGQTVKVYFNVRGRQWQDKYFVSLNGWRIEVVKDLAKDIEFTPDPSSVVESPEANAYNDELPF
jgi:single-strand DNA-binding protein